MLTFDVSCRQERCVRCMVINEKHANVLQYKESKSVPLMFSSTSLTNAFPMACSLLFPEEVAILERSVLGDKWRCLALLALPM